MVINKRDLKDQLYLEGKGRDRLVRERGVSRRDHSFLAGGAV